MINELVNSMWCFWLSHPLECARIYRKHANIWGFSLLSVDILGWYAVAFWINNSLIENSKVFIKKLKQVDFYDIRWWKWRHSLCRFSMCMWKKCNRVNQTKWKSFTKTAQEITVHVLFMGLRTTWWSIMQEYPKNLFIMAGCVKRHICIWNWTTFQHAIGSEQWWKREWEKRDKNSGRMRLTATKIKIRTCCVWILNIIYL